MNTFRVAPGTINAIFGQLGDPNRFSERYLHEGAIPNGQIVKPNDFGGHSYEPKQFAYKAEVIKGEEKLNWKITSISIIGDEGAKLLW